MFEGDVIIIHRGLPLKIEKLEGVEDIECEGTLRLVN